jgi:plasmid stabilization system protein ParE
MRVEYSKRALTDIRQIAAYYARPGERIAVRIQEVVARIAGWPFSGAPSLSGRAFAAGMRWFLLALVLAET